MPRNTIFIVTFIALSATFNSLSADRVLSKDVENGRGINLSDYGGPNIVIGVSAVEMTYALGYVNDYTRMVPQIEGNSIANAEIVMVPTWMSIKVEKSGAAPIEQGLKKGVLLYTEPKSKIRVWFLDEIAPLNHYRIAVSVPEKAQPPALPNVPTKFGEHEGQNNAGDKVLSPELLAWYLKLQRERQVLNTDDDAAVRRFNQQAAEYHEALRVSRKAKLPK